jgi:uncharacterized protein DUF3631
MPLRSPQRGPPYRQQDNWEPPLAIAAVAGGSWPERARSAATAASEAPAEESPQMQLLLDIRGVFGGEGLRGEKPRGEGLQGEGAAGRRAAGRFSAKPWLRRFSRCKTGLGANATKAKL